MVPGGFASAESICIHTLHCSQDSTPPEKLPDTVSGIWIQSSSMIQCNDVQIRDFTTSTNFSKTKDEGSTCPVQILNRHPWISIRAGLQRKN